MRAKMISRTLLFVFLAWLALPASAAVPVTSSHQVLELESLDAVVFPSLNTELLAWEDEEREEMGMAPRFAVTKEVKVSPVTHGTWEELSEGMQLWRLRVESLGALSLNFGFTRYLMPEGGSLFLYAADESYELSRAFTAEDNETHGELWTPVVLSDNVIIELIVPTKAVDSLELELTAVNIGYRGFGENLTILQGSCNNDVICPEGVPWLDEIASVGVISTGGGTFCTGFMVNNTAEDETPYFMTANHCGINSGSAASLVVYWNFESPTCGALSGGSLSDFQTGSFFRSSYSTSDFTLVELDSAPNPDHNVSFSGWSRSSGASSSAVAIHHPNTDEKARLLRLAALRPEPPGDRPAPRRIRLVHQPDLGLVWLFLHLLDRRRQQLHPAEQLARPHRQRRHHR